MRVQRSAGLSLQSRSFTWHGKGRSHLREWSPQGQTPGISRQVRQRQNSLLTARSTHISVRIYRVWRKTEVYVPPEGMMSLAFQATPGSLPGLRVPGEFPKRSSPSTVWGEKPARLNISLGGGAAALPQRACLVQLSHCSGPVRHSTIREQCQLQAQMQRAEAVPPLEGRTCLGLYQRPITGRHCPARPPCKLRPAGGGPSPSRRAERNAPASPAKGCSAAGGA